MLSQIFKFAIRSFGKSKSIHCINLFSLILGLSTFILISLYIYQENSFERGFENRNQTFQISYEMLGSRLAIGSPNLTYVLGEIPEVEAHTRFSQAPQAMLRWEDEKFEVKALYVNSTFFDVFDFDLNGVDQQTALKEPNSVIIDERKAQELFGTTDVIGRLIKVGGNSQDSLASPAIIRAVSKHPKFKTQIDFDILVSENTNKPTSLNLDGWQTARYYNYIVATPGADVATLNKRLDEISYKYIYPKTILGGNRTAEEWKNAPLYCGFFVESLDNLRQTSDTKLNLMPKVEEGQIKTLAIIAIAALVLSVVNFVNISTSRASVRMKEVGVKRILGSSRFLLILQFVTEAFSLVLLASILSLGLVEVISTVKPSFLGIEIEYSVLQSLEWVLAVIGFLAFTTIIASLYPALYLSSGKPSTMLRKGDPVKSFSVLNASLFRKATTVIQFSASISLIVAVLTMFLQVGHLRDRDIGYKSNDVLVVDNTYHLGESKEAFKNELMRSTVVASAAYSDRLPSTFTFKNPRPIQVNDSTEVNFSVFRVDTTFFDVMQMKFVKGKPFSQKPKAGEDSELVALGQAASFSVVVNEVGAKLMGFDNPIGQVFFKKGQIVGVVEDFVFSDLRKEVGPVMMVARQGKGRYTYSDPLVIRVASKNASIDEIEEVWSKFSTRSMKWHRLDSHYNELIAIEQQGFQAVLVFSILAVAISCLGLLGLATFTVDQRTHEFGIRKVLGASVVDIIRLFGQSFIALTVIAFVIAVPISIYTMNNWLRNFADRIELQSGIFIWAALITICIVLNTVFFQSLKAGRLNPIDTLRNE